MTPEQAPTDHDLPPMIRTEPGHYRHYKGGLYEVIDTVRHSESLEPMTLYRALYGEQGLWVRPAAMFAQSVTIQTPTGSQTVARFQLIDKTPKANAAPKTNR